MGYNFSWTVLLRFVTLGKLDMINDTVRKFIPFYLLKSESPGHNKRNSFHGALVRKLTEMSKRRYRL
ncbi:hypothetical protein DTX80_11005 [Bacilli bacterium]|uniref:Transposase n=1 Tax=Oceanobacillus caeni TaxID=405946 RepID=A0ABR5MIG6_9BACI|nr:hypothetical protein WH51_16950 [Bacilli bacterium VT-13-104]KPH74319.1 hypothetical protein AFL42_10520 [Oceanobacillus caeni]PZD83876.1 hypothetical protein DEJ64_13535 [Bacilli bacterium]PZD84967.1 hypothetical protein DEJ60_13385 [Bacilli bacterium]PZD87564.1 hypothetical protein DEJ66_13895 [Bacilli bacterium]